MNHKKKSRLSQDRLSDLHDALLIQILCLMELKDVIKTSLVSKRWNKLWTQVDTINYTCHSLPDFEPESVQHMKDQAKRYISCVYTTLTRGISRIRNFSLAGFDFLTESHLVDKWIEYALELKVETLNIDYEHLYSCSPCSLFQSSSLTQLNLYKCLVGWPSPVYMPLLKSLSLVNITPENTHLKDLLSGCPVLETLVLIEITWWNSDVSVISRSLRKLKIVDVNYGHSVNYILEIRTPLLQELEISGSFMVRWCVTADFSSLVKANLLLTICQPTFVNAHGYRLEAGLEGTIMETKFSNDWIRMVEGLLKSVCQVGELSIGGDLLQVLTLSAVSRKASPVFMCKHLTVVSPPWKYDLPGIIYLLKAAPHLKNIYFDVSKTKIHSPFDQVNEALYVAYQHLGSYANEKFLHLKSVKIVYQRNSCVDCPPNSFQIEENCGDFELVDYILKSSVSLERLVVYSPRTCGNETKCLKPYCAFQHVNQLSCKLLTHTLPSNEDGEWELKKRKFSLEYTFSS